MNVKKEIYSRENGESYILFKLNDMYYSTDSSEWIINTYIGSDGEDKYDTFKLKYIKIYEN